MTTKVLMAAGAVAASLTFSMPAAQAGYMLPGETMGVSLVSPLPEGVFFADLESYGRADRQPDANIGVNIPVIIWSTPWSFYNTRLEFIAALPFVHIDANTGVPATDALLNQTGAITWTAGPMFAHDFGNGLTGGFAALFRSPTPTEAVRTLDGRTDFEMDFRQSAQYTFQGFLGGITVIENAAYTTSFGGKGNIGAAGVGVLPNDMFAGDFAIEKTFDKFTIGFTGFGNIDTTSNFGSYRQASVELGGLVGYDFGKFSLTGIVTRSVLVSGVGLPGGGVSDTVAGVASGNGYETRGWVRLVVPLYVAPTAPLVRARY